MRGDLSARRLDALGQNVECPSLSPDGKRIADKYRTGSQWRLHVLDLGTGAGTTLADPSHVDDQPMWLDADTVGYTRPVNNSPMIFSVPADGGGRPRALHPGSSPGFVSTPPRNS